MGEVELKPGRLKRDADRAPKRVDEWRTTPMTDTTHNIDRKASDQILLDIQDLEKRAYDAGLTYCAKGLNNALNAAGWQLAGNSEAAIKALHGDRPQ